MSGAAVLLWIGLAVTLSETWSEEVQVSSHCDANVELICGDAWSRFRMRWCQPEMVGLKKIIDVQLNTGFSHRYCRRNNSNMFGIGANGTTIWVSNWCYGTFNVCIELEQSIVTAENETDGVTTTAPNSNEQTYDYADSVTAHSSTGASNNHGLESKQTVSMHIPRESRSTTESSNTLFQAPGIIVTGAHRDNTNSNYSTTTSPVSQGAHDVTADNNTTMDPVLKIILMAGIATGGLVLLLMICIAAYMIHTCKRKTSREMYDKSSATKGRPKLSTAALVTSDCLNEHTNGLYDFIPCDRAFTNTITFNRPLSGSNRPKASNKDKDRTRKDVPHSDVVGNTENHEYFTLAKEEVCEHCVPKLQHNMDINNAYSHTQEVLQQRRTSDALKTKHTQSAYVHDNFNTNARRPLRCGSCDTESSRCGGYDAKPMRCGSCDTASESVYDRLVSVPRASVSDGAEYHHLGTFSRERKMTVDMSTQTDIDELK